MRICEPAQQRRQTELAKQSDVVVVGVRDQRPLQSAVKRARFLALIPYPDTHNV